MKAIDRTGVDYYIQASDVELIQKTVRSILTAQDVQVVCVNVGAAMGTSTLAMLEARPDSIVFSIDIEDCPLETEALEQSDIPDWRERYIFSRGDSHESIGKNWCPRSVDFVFVDGDHSYIGCYEDGRVWYEALKYGGYMAFHDYGAETPALAQVKPAVDDITRMLGLEFVEHVGKLIVFRKADAQSTIRISKFTLIGYIPIVSTCESVDEKYIENNIVTQSDLVREIQKREVICRRDSIDVDFHEDDLTNGKIVLSEIYKLCNVLIAAVRNAYGREYKFDIAVGFRQHYMSCVFEATAMQAVKPAVDDITSRLGMTRIDRVGNLAVFRKER